MTEGRQRGSDQDSQRLKIMLRILSELGAKSDSAITDSPELREYFLHALDDPQIREALREALDNFISRDPDRRSRFPGLSLDKLREQAASNPEDVVLLFKLALALLGIELLEFIVQSAFDELGIDEAVGELTQEIVQHADQAIERSANHLPALGTLAAETIILYQVGAQQRSGRRVRVGTTAERPATVIGTTAERPGTVIDERTAGEPAEPTRHLPGLDTQDPRA